MFDGSHSKRPNPPGDWLWLVLIALITFGAVIAVSALLLPKPKDLSHVDR